jgi:hypothetical protein
MRLPAGDGVVEGRVEWHGVVEAGDLEQAPNPSLGAHQA